MNKAYERINWENYPSENTALNEANLNKMDAALNEVDNRVVAHETTKLDVATANSMVKNVSFNERSGIFTITYLNGSTKELDTKLEKIATNFVYDEERQKLILTLIDGTTQEIDMSALVTQYEFENSAYISFAVVNGKVKAEIINGSITADKLQPNFLADVTLQANSAKTSEQNAKVSEENAKQSEINAKNYADSAEPVASTAQGLNPTLENSTGAPIISFKGDGATEQQTYSGKNKLNVTATSKTQEGITFTVNADKSVTLNGTSTTRIYFKIGDIVDVEETSYILSGTPKGSSSGAPFLYASHTTEGVTDKHDLGNGVTIDNIADYGNISICVPVNITVNNATFYPMIRLATETNATYEPYVGGTASPNPSYPQDIHGVGESGSLEVRSTGKNIFGGLAFAQAIVDNFGGTLNESEKTVLFYASNDLAGKAIKEGGFKENTQYTFILKGMCTNSSYKYSNIRVAYTDGTSGGNIPFETAGSVSTIKYTSASGKTVDSIKFIYGAGGTVFNYEECGIFEGVITADEFEPYVETKANIPLSAPLYEGDYIRLNMDGSGELHRNMAYISVAKSEFNKVTGAANTYYQTSAKYPKDAYGTQNDKRGVMRCNMSRQLFNPDYSGQGMAWIATISGANGALVRVSTDVYEALSDTQNVEFVYKLAEPTVTPLTDEQIAEFEKLRTFDGTTHVTCEAESEIQYFYDSVGGKAVASVVSKVERELSDFDITLARTSITATSAFNKTKFDRSILSDFDYETGQVMSTDGDDLSVADALAHLEGAVIDIMNGVIANKAKIDALTS